ncbi:hypothetical protein G3I75_05745 [Pseudomonas aeruginosa]|nr:hypothetical protein G3I75_05745 [Pseudomonas aeruginosa]
MNTGVTAGVYTKVNVNSTGRVIAGSTLVQNDIPALDASKITSGMFADARLPWYAQGLCTSAPITEDPNTTNIPLILTNHANGPISGQYFYIQTMMYNQRNGNAAQIAVRYAANAEMYVRYMYNEGNKRGAWSPWKRCDVGEHLQKRPMPPRRQCKPELLRPVGLGLPAVRSLCAERFKLPDTESRQAHYS